VNDDEVDIAPARLASFVNRSSMPARFCNRRQQQNKTYTTKSKYQPSKTTKTKRTRRPQSNTIETQTEHMRVLRGGPSSRLGALRSRARAPPARAAVCRPMLSMTTTTTIDNDDDQNHDVSVRGCSFCVVKVRVKLPALSILAGGNAC
jgi:hypothetical protein